MLVCFIYLFIYVYHDLLGHASAFYAFGFFCNTPIYLTLFTILTLQNKRFDLN